MFVAGASKHQFKMEETHYTNDARGYNKKNYGEQSGTTMYNQGSYVGIFLVEQ